MINSALHREKQISMISLFQAQNLTQMMRDSPLTKNNKNLALRLPMRSLLHEDDRAIAVSPDDSLEVAAAENASRQPTEASINCAVSAT